MPAVHRDTDKRSCGAKTIAQNPNVYANGLLVAVDGNENSHGGGNLKAANPNVHVGGKLVVIHGPNDASADNLCPLPPSHCNPKTAAGSPNVFVGG